MTLLNTLGAIVALIAVSTAPAWAEPRIALVVGNQTYAAVTPLDNPVADAELISAKLIEKGFDVTLLTDGGQVDLNRAIAQFGRDLRNAGEEATGLFYYAGHGVQSFGANFLLPVDVTLTDAADLSLVAVRADAVLRQMASARNQTNIFILDACRNNPFVDIPDMNDNGLAEMKAPTGTFMAYSTAPGSVALDGTTGNSPFTESLARQMDAPGMTVEAVFKGVRSSVLEATQNQQTPWDASSLTSDFIFTPAEYRSPEELAAERFFNSIKETRDPVQIVLFLRTYPDSEYYEEARGLLSQALDGSAPETGQGAPQPAEVASEPEQSEQDLINAARQSGELADYEAYLAQYPDGTFAELARMEISAKVAKDPEAPEGGLQEQPAPEQKTAEIADKADPEAVLVLFDQPLTRGGPDVEGLSIEQLVGGSPLFPPIEGLPDEVWKDRSCTTCHVWTREDLCAQAQVYLSESGTRSLSKQHPYGGGLKQNLRDWAAHDCR